MKTSPLLAGVAGLTLIALTATTLYAQTVAGSSIIDKMKATARNSFALSADLNPGQTGFDSAPVSGKKTGDILTAGEWNRVLELVSSGGAATASLPQGAWCGLTVTQATPAGVEMIKIDGTNVVAGVKQNVALCEGHDPSVSCPSGYARVFHWSTAYVSNTTIPGKMEFCVNKTGSTGGSGGSGWENVPLTDTADYDQTCLYQAKLQTTDADNNNYVNGTISTRFAVVRSPKYLGFMFTAGSGIVDAVWGIPSATKSSYGYRDRTGTFTLASNVTILNLQKNCGGGGGGGSSSELQLSNESPTTAPNFIEATKYCKNLTEGGYSDWRFPNLSELFVFAPISTDTNFLWTNAVDYSQGTANANPGYWGKLRMSDGYFSATSGPGDDVAYVRCVRGS